MRAILVRCNGGVIGRVKLPWATELHLLVYYQTAVFSLSVLFPYVLLRALHAILTAPPALPYFQTIQYYETVILHRNCVNISACEHSIERTLCSLAARRGGARIIAAATIFPGEVCERACESGRGGRKGGEDKEGFVQGGGGIDIAV